MDIFAEYKVVTGCMFGCLVLSIFVKVFLGLLYNQMIKEADNMAATNNKLLKQCKVKFSNCYELNNGISNIPIFVDKFINRLALGPFSFEMLYHLSGQTMLLSVVFSGVGVCISIMDGHTLGAILPFYIVSFAGLYLYFSVSTVVDIKGKKRVLRVNLVDYLENHLSPRIHVTRQDIERLYGVEGYESLAEMRLGSGERGGRIEDMQSVNRKSRKTVELMPIGNRTSGAREEMQTGRAYQEEKLRRLDKPEENSAAVTEEELEALLKEFLTG